MRGRARGRARGRMRRGIVRVLSGGGARERRRHTLSGVRISGESGHARTDVTYVRVVRYQAGARRENRERVGDGGSRAVSSGEGAKKGEVLARGGSDAGAAGQGRVTRARGGKAPPAPAFFPSSQNVVEETPSPQQGGEEAAARRAVFSAAAGAPPDT
eukprot:3982782-Pyramimonas_sp.AAC.2